MQETVKEKNPYIQCPRTRNKPNGRECELVGGLCKEVCNLNLGVKDEIIKVIRLGKKQTDGDAGDTEQKPRPREVVMKDTNKKLELFKQQSHLREAEDKYKCLSILHDLKKREEGKEFVEER